MVITGCYYSSRKIRKLCLEFSLMLISNITNTVQKNLIKMLNDSNKNMFYTLSYTSIDKYSPEMCEEP